MRDRFDKLSAPGRLALFGALLVVVGAAAVGVGAATRGKTTPPSDNGSAMAAMGTASQAHADGLATSADGFTFEPARTRFTPGANTLRFRIADDQGGAHHDFALEGGVRLHLIVARRDLVGYEHVHPTLQADGSWLAHLRFVRAGVYRAFADFERDGTKTVLGADLFVAGPMQPVPLPAAQTTAVVDGYRVQLAAPSLHADKTATATFTVTRRGAPVRSFQSYVGMRGHLVALHAGDLSYSHVHPLELHGAGQIAFNVSLPAGAHRLFLQFKTAGRVHTAPFTVRVGR